MDEIIEKLNKKTKSEIIDIVCDMIDAGEIYEDAIKNRITVIDYNPEEQVIIDKLVAKEALTADELEYTQHSLSYRGNAKIRSVLNGSGKRFDAFLVNAKIKQYFNAIWKIYPRKVGKEMGLKAFTKLVGEKKLSQLKEYCEYIAKRVTQYIDYCEQNNVEEQYILHFSTFCNSKKYL